MEQMIIGIDFDNTIACYDDVFASSAIEFGFLPKNFEGSKKHVRDALRLKPGGEMEWQRLQGVVYGSYMHRAKPFDDLNAFLQTCCRLSIPVYIISHKTRTNPFDLDQVDLREAALSWMIDQQFFDDTRFGIKRENVFFEDDRDKKIERLRATPCTHFIDDLIEVLSESKFPKDVVRILFDPTDTPSADVTFTHAHSWSAISNILFGTYADHDT
jgi:hypothetical protein